jgi:hypothetical protein
MGDGKPNKHSPPNYRIRERWEEGEKLDFRSASFQRTQRGFFEYVDAIEEWGLNISPSQNPNSKYT